MKRQCGEWGKKLRHYGFKCTAGRELILNVIQASNGHLTPEEIYQKVQEYHPEIGFTTVYRTLDLLLKLTIIIKLDFGDGKSRYELSENFSTRKHHHHLMCTECGKIIDYSDFMNEETEFLNKIEQKLGERHQFKITSHFIKFDGLCSDCL